MSGRVAHLVVAVALCATAACGATTAPGTTDDTGSETVGDQQPTGPDDRGVLSVAEAATRSGERVTVRGWLVDDGATTVVAALLAESYPPQAGGDTLTVEAPSIADDVTLEQVGDVRWSTRQVLVTGVVDDGAIADAQVVPDPAAG